MSNENPQPDAKQTQQGSALTLIKSLVFAMIGPGTVTVLVPWLLLSSQGGPLGSGFVFRAVGTVSILFGVLAAGWCMWDFVFTGRGTPAPIDPPKNLVVRGFYRHVRNPMYVSIAAILLGEAVFFGSGRLLCYAAFILLCFHLFVVFHEEPHLRSRFGVAYEAYCAVVPRWIPKIKSAG
jgi:protein-S-isoprenylcysteine O-methyltransferase Ste14